MVLLGLLQHCASQVSLSFMLQRTAEIEDVRHDLGLQYQRMDYSVIISLFVFLPFGSVSVMIYVLALSQEYADCKDETACETSNTLDVGLRLQ